MDSQLQARFPGRGLDSIVLLEKKHPEAVNPGILQRQAIFRFVHSEPARAAGTGGEKDVLVNDVLARYAAGLESLQILDEVPNCEVSGIALPVVALLFAELEGINVGYPQNVATISGAPKYSLKHL